MKNSTQKGFVIPLVIAIIVLIIAGGAYVTWKQNKTVTPANNEVSTNDSAAGASSTPVITSITPTSGPIGTTVEIRGTALAGFEGDLDAYIENSKGERAFLPGIGSVPRTDGVIRVKIDGNLCQQNNGYSGKPCTSYLTITPGIYSLFTIPWGVMSNKVKFTVTAAGSTSDWKTYTNDRFGFEMQFPPYGYTTRDAFRFAEDYGSYVIEFRMPNPSNSVKTQALFIEIYPKDQIKYVQNKGPINTSIGGVPATKSSDHIYFVRNDLGYDIQILGPGFEDAEKMLSTFKFTN